jgi:hypothetical protein
VRLNGVLLRVELDGALPPFKAQLMTGPVIMPPLSLAFLQPAVLPVAAASVRGVMCAASVRVPVTFM